MLHKAILLVIFFELFVCYRTIAAAFTRANSIAFGFQRVASKPTITQEPYSSVGLCSLARPDSHLKLCPRQFNYDSYPSWTYIEQFLLTTL
jgi:hypothetical protein